MDDELRELMAKEVEYQVANLRNLQAGSDEHKNASESLKKICDVLSQDVKDQVAVNEQMIKEDLELKKLKMETEIKKKEERNHWWSTVAHIAIDGIAVAGGLMLNNIWMKRGFEFEKEGTYTSGTFRSLFPKFTFKK